MSFNVFILDNCLPALTYTIVAGNIPKALTQKKVHVLIGSNDATTLTTKKGKTGTNLNAKI